MKYSATFRETMVKKLCGPDSVSANELSRQTGVPQQTLSRWLRDAKIATIMDSGKKETSSRGRSRRPRDWTAEERLEAVTRTAKMGDEELGAYLRQTGLRSTDLERWKEATLTALGRPGARAKRRDAKDKKRIRELEKELRRKEKALAESAALLILKKKAQAIWGDADDDIL